MTRKDGIAMCLIALVVAAALALIISYYSPSVEAQSSVGGGGIVALQPTIADPCMNSTVAKSSVAVSVASATTTQLVAAVAGKSIFVCQFDMTIGGTTVTAQFKSGTQVTNPCDTGPANMTGVYAPTSGNEVSAQGASTLMSTPVASQLCITTAGTGVAVGGLVTFVQQ